MFCSKGFPSGHASFTTYVTLYLIVYLEMRLFVTTLHFPKVTEHPLVCGLCLHSSGVVDHPNPALPDSTVAFSPIS